MTPARPTLASLAAEQPHATRVLRRLGPSARRPHALALSGAPATGIARLGQALVRALMCSEPRDPFDACGHCPSCSQGEEQHQTRLLRLGDDEQVPGVSDIRALEGRLSLRTQGPEGKVVLLPRACQLRPPAQNALLKVLEEPPAGTSFVLLAERWAALLPTVRSRLVRVQLTMPPLSLVHDTLTRAGIASELTPLLLPFCGTDVAAAKSLLDAGLVELLDELRSHLALGTPSHQTTRLAQRLGQKGPLGPQALGLLEVLMRDALAYKLGARQTLDPEATARALWIEADAAQISLAIARLAEARALEVFNPNRALLCETLLLTLNRREIAS